MSRSALHTVGLAFVAFLYGAEPAHGDRGAGIAVDLAIDQALREIEVEDARKTELDNVVASLTQRERQLRSALRDHVRALYRITRTGTTPIAGGFAAMRQHLSRVRRLKSIVEHDLQTVGALQQDCDSAREQAGRAQLAAAAARSRLARLRSAQADPPLARGDAVDAARAGSDHGFYGLRLTSGQNVTAFEGLRGKLAPPVSGELRLRDATRGSASALLFEAAAGTSVRAAAAGRVAYADAHSVVLDHGDGYQTAYGQLGNVEVRAGDEVSSHARLGSIADGDNPSLLFEIRRGPRSLSPRPWLGF